MNNPRFMIPQPAMAPQVFIIEESDPCDGCRGNEYNGDGEPPCFYCDPGAPDMPPIPEYNTIEGLIEDAQDHGFKVVTHSDGPAGGLFITTTCSVCGSNAMLLLVNNNGRSAVACTCGYKRWAQ